MLEKKISKTKLCSSTGIARTTLDAILNGSDAKISTIEAIAGVLKVKIGALFDEGEATIHTEGDYSPAVGNSENVSVIVGDAVLTERVKMLEALLEEKERLIKVLMQR